MIMADCFSNLHDSSRIDTVPQKNHSRHLLKYTNSLAVVYFPFIVAHLSVSHIAIDFILNVELVKIFSLASLRDITNEDSDVICGRRHQMYSLTGFEFKWPGAVKRYT